MIKLIEVYLGVWPLIYGIDLNLGIIFVFDLHYLRVSFKGLGIGLIFLRNVGILI